MLSREMISDDEYQRRSDRPEVPVTIIPTRIITMYWAAWENAGPVKGAEQLGLQGSVDKDVFTRLLEGRLPDGADLSRMQDGSNKHRPGYDLTFSAPKSVSMMAMLGGDKRLIDAHNQAVDFAVRQVEALASTRVMTDGQSETVLTGNLVMALFNHDTSRDQEPQLHTHAVVANVTQHNGEWKTLSTDKVGKTGFIPRMCYANQIAFGRLYRVKN